MNRNAIMPLKMRNTRFAPSEGLLESFYGSRRVFRAFVKYSVFEQLYPSKGEEARKKRQASFKEAVKSKELIKNVCKLLRILGTIRGYLRLFESYNCNICEVYQLKLPLEQRINSLQTDSFLTPGRLK